MASRLSAADGRYDGDSLDDDDSSGARRSVDRASRQQPNESDNADRTLVSESARTAVDLETALHRICRTPEEQVSASSRIAFRLGHPCDVSAIVRLYRRTTVGCVDDDRTYERRMQDSDENEDPEKGAQDSAGRPRDSPEDQRSDSHRRQSNDRQGSNRATQTGHDTKEPPSPSISRTESESTDIFNQGNPSRPVPASAMELSLAEAMGSEDRPPSVFALLVDLRQNNDGHDSDPNISVPGLRVPSLADAKSVSDCGSGDSESAPIDGRRNTSQTIPTAAEQQSVHSPANPAQAMDRPVPPIAVALLSQAYERYKRTLRVEWLYIDDRLDGRLSRTVQRRIWLRLSMLSILTNSTCLVVIEESTPRTAVSATATTSKEVPSKANASAD